MTEFHNKKIKTFGVIVTVFIIIIIIISIYFSCKNNFFFLFIFGCIVLLSYICFGYFFDEVKLKKPTYQSGKAEKMMCAYADLISYCIKKGG